jgi:hypothetical protein
MRPRPQAPYTWDPETNSAQYRTCWTSTVGGIATLREAADSHAGHRCRPPGHAKPARVLPFRPRA